MRLMGGSGPTVAPWLARLGVKSHSTERLTQLRHDGRVSSHYQDWRLVVGSAKTCILLLPF